MSNHRLAISLATAFLLVAPYAYADHHMSGADASPEAAPAEVEVAAWDAKRVAELATTVAEQAGLVRRAISQQPPQLPGSGQQKFQYRLRDEVRLIRIGAEQLAVAVGKGGTMEETHPIYMRLRQLVLSAREDAVKMRLDKSTLEHVAKAREALTELAPLYGEEPLEALPGLEPGEAS